MDLHVFQSGGHLCLSNTSQLPFAYHAYVYLVYLLLLLLMQAQMTRLTQSLL